MALVLNGDGNIAGLTAGGLPDASVTQSELAANIAGNGPAFHCYMPTTQAISATTFTKIAFSTELYDTNSCYDNSTYRFTPNVAGYYQFNFAIYSQTGNQLFITRTYKNGSYFVENHRLSGYSTAPTIPGSVLVYANGTTDYFELYGYGGGSTTIGSGDGALVWWTGFLARAA
jgi:hypothetical protein